MKQKRIWLGGLLTLSFCLCAGLAGCKLQGLGNGGGTSGAETPPKTDVPAQISQAAIDSVSGRVKFSGTYLYDESGEGSMDSAHDLSTTFGDGYVHCLDKDSTTEEVYYNYVYANRDGKVALLYRTVTNGIDYQLSTVDFSTYYNLFSTLTPDDFVATEEVGTFTVKEESLETASSVAENITGWVETLASFTVTVENDKIVKLHMVTEEIVLDETEGISYVSDYTLTASEWGTAEVDSFYLNPYEHTSQHDVLTAALRSASTAGNYTVRHVDHEDGYDDVDYFVYVGKDALYNAFDKNGYVAKDGYVYPFEYDEKTEKITLSDALNVTSFASVKADFLSVCAELFAPQGNGVYVLRDNDMASSVLPFLGEGVDEIQLYAYATSMKIVLNEERLQSVEFDYYVWGVEGHVTLTYSAFGETTLPVSFDNMEQTSVLDAYVGEYEDEYGNTAIVTVEDGIVINEKAFTISSYDSENGLFIGTWDDRSVYAGKLTTRQLMLCDENGNVLFLFVLKTEEKVAVPDDYIGTWEGADEDKAEHKLVIAADSVTLDGVSLTLLSYVASEGLVAVKGEVTYDFLLQNGAMGVIIVENNAYVNIYALQKTSVSSVIPSAFIGTYEGEKNDVTYSVAITATEITITAGTDSAVAAITAYDDYEGFTLTWQGATYYLMNAGYTDEVNSIALMSEDYRTLNVVLSRKTTSGGGDPAPTVTVPEKFIGDYTGVNADGTGYYGVAISANGIFVNINGSGYTAEIVSYDDSEGFTIKLDGATYYLMQDGYGEPVTSLRLMSEDYSLSVVLGKL